MRSALLLIGLAMVAACPMPPQFSSEPRPGQEEALAIIGAHMGAPMTMPVVWLEGDELDCGAGDDSEQYTGWMAHGICYEGGTEVHRRAWGDMFPIQVILAVYPTLADSALAHESCHVIKGDYGHEGLCQDDGPLIQGTVAALRAAGL